MKRAKLAELFRKDYVQTVVMIIITIMIVIVFWYGLTFAFRTEHPLLAVASGSMEPTLYKGDLILVQGVHNACEIHAASKDANPPGDIIIFHKPTDPSELIVHRAVEKINEDGSCYFYTQGDNARTNPGRDPWTVRESDIVGEYTGAKVPWLGHIALFFEPFEVKVAFILLWIVLLILLELVPLLRKKVEESKTETGSVNSSGLRKQKMAKVLNFLSQTQTYVSFVTCTYNSPRPAKKTETER
jgi:signal peptidase I